MATNQPKLIPLDAWAKLVFGEHAPHRNTLYNWRQYGWIVPAPIKIGRRYFVEPNAVYADLDGEMARRLGGDQ
ncbi:excisionase [Paraburkholderia phenoliruptrix]|uniref:excisionase n=1 Tax=Paraburkholderia phenoliruptrix TaxID=252970 RepID=UPI003D98F32A